MKINIPQYLRASVNHRSFDTPDWEDRKVDVWIGETIVFSASVDGYYDDEDAEMEAISQFGRMLKLKIGD